MQPQTARCTSQSNIELMSKKQVFDFKVAPRSEQISGNVLSRRRIASIASGPMTVQRDQNRPPNLLRGAKYQLMLLGAATLVLLFFAWTYID